MSCLGSDPPAAPDPKAVSKAQTDSNIQSALWNAGLNRINESNPYSDLTYTQNGVDSNGVPQYTRKTTLNPQIQHALDAQLNQNDSLSTGADSLTRQINNNYSASMPDYNKSYNDALDANYARNTQFLDPQYERQQNQMDAQLANQGITQGSQAWQTAHDEFGRQKSFDYQNARNNAATSAGQEQSRAVQLGAALRDLPMSELGSLRNITNTQTPQLTPMQSVGMNPTNTAANAWQNYAGQQAAYNAGVGQQNALMSTAGQLGSGYLQNPNMQTGMGGCGGAGAGAPGIGAGTQMGGFGGLGAGDLGAGAMGGGMMGGAGAAGGADAAAGAGSAGGMTACSSGAAEAAPLVMAA